MALETRYTPIYLRFLCAYNIQKVLPAVYDDSLSYYEVLCKVQDKLNEVVVSENYLSEWQAAQDEALATLESEFEDFKESGFDDYYKEQVERWIDENFQTVMDGLLGHMVFFGLTETGYFTAYIPAKWAFVFDTLMDYSSDSYGCLSIIY